MSRAKRNTRKRFWVMDTEDNGVLGGPFDTLTETEKWLRDDARCNFLDADKSLRDSSSEQPWAAPVIILQERKIVRQVPRVKVEVELQRAIP